MRIFKTVIAWMVLLALTAAGVWIYLGQKPKSVEAPGGAKDEASQALSVRYNEKQAETVQLELARLESFVQELSAVGSIDFNQYRLVQVFTPYQGRIITALPSAGDKVAQGDVLFTIDSSDLLTAETALITTAGVFKLQSKTLQRVKKMESFGGASQQAVDQSTSDQMSAEGAMKSARDAVRIFGKTPDEVEKIIAERKADPRLVVVSPISGYVTARSAAPGLLVQPGVAPPPYTVADLSSMWMFANVPESDVSKLAVGQQVKARVAAFPDKAFEGTVTVIGPSVDPNTRRTFVRSEIADPDHLLKAGMFANFTIRIGDETQVLAVPIEAIVREGDGTQTLWVTTDKLVFTRKTVKIGREQNGLVEILEGISAGEQVATKGALFLSNKLAGGATD